MKKTRRILAGLLALVLSLVLVVPAFAATSDDVVVTATPEYIAITNAPATWTVNGLTGNSVIVVSTTYYSNPVGDTTVPTSTVVDGDCRFTVTNTSSVAIDLTVNFPDHTGGDASSNSDTGSGAATSFGAYTYFSGETFASKVIAKDTGSDVALDALGATTDILWGIEYDSQDNAWTSGTAMTSTVTITATAD